jgi:DNA-binding SARP family transcriptional activator/tetratricopeptide (TPR) repeat protein
VLEFRVLGPVEVRSSGRLVDAGPARQRGVLAALAADAGRPVQTETLVDRVWGDAPPQRARHTLHVYIARLRRVLGEAGAVELARRSGGYVLDVDGDCVDLHRFRALVEQARGEPCPDSRRVALLRQALELWRGTPLADLPGEWAARVREGWQRQHLDTVLCWAQAELRVGNPDVVIEQLAELTAKHPLAEPLVAAQMRALSAAGRGAEALQGYAATRTRLAEALGADPSPELQALHQAILRGNLAPARSVPASASQVSQVPAQLPLDVRGFTGRADELARLDAILSTVDRQPTAVIISAVSGTAGVGKTALAVHWVHAVADRFPDGQLYVNLRGFDPGGAATSPAEAVRGFLDALQVPPQRIPASLQAQVNLYRSLLAGRRVAVVLDNARDAEQVRPLLPGAPGCLVIVTSRNLLPGLVAAEGAQPLTLDLMTAGEAWDMLAARLGPARLAAEPSAVDEIITGCARLPLALSIVAARAATNPGFPLGVLAKELRDSCGGLDAFAGTDAATDMRAVFSLSYNALGTEAAQVYRLLGLHPGPDIAAPGAASLAGIPLDRTRQLLAELARAHLVAEHTPGRYTFHDLLRAYAKELAHSLDSGTDRHAATHRALDHYLHSACTAAWLLEPQREIITLTPPQPGVTLATLYDPAQSMAWLTSEHPVLVAAIAQAADGGFGTHTWQLACTLTTFFQRRGYWQEQIAADHTALRAARQMADATGQAHAHHGLARAHLRLGHDDDAYTHLEHTLRLCRELGDPVGEARAHDSLGLVSAHRGDHIEALYHTQRALDLFHAAGHRGGYAQVLNDIGWRHALLGHYRQALTYCWRALILLRELADQHGQASTWDSLGYAYHHLGQHTRAIACYQRALHLFREVGERYLEADTLTHLGDTHNATSNPDTARSVWQSALDILDELDHPDADRVRLKLLARR